jgi:hypothetical protein
MKNLFISGELLLAELAPFTFDRYVTREDYARISWQTTLTGISPLPDLNQ